MGRVQRGAAGPTGYALCRSDPLTCTWVACLWWLLLVVPACGGRGCRWPYCPRRVGLVGRWWLPGWVGACGCGGRGGLQDRRTFEETARDWTRRFAS